MEIKIQKHLQYFKVENFKGFESLELNNIGQINLIAGDNNIGKSSLLEALMFDESLVHLISRLSHVFCFKSNADIKENNNFLEVFVNRKAKDNKIKFYSQQLESKNLNEYILDSFKLDGLSDKEKGILKEQSIVQNRSKYVATLKRNSDLIDIQFIDAENDENYTPFVFYNLGYRDDLVEFYSDNIQKSKELKDKLINNLKIFIPEIYDVEVSQSHYIDSVSISVRLNNIDELMPLAMLGDGAIKFFRILLEIVQCRGKKLMVDEIDTGIHYSRFKLFWKSIIMAAIDNDVQLFATTHNLECLKYFKEALEEKDMIQYQKDARHFLIEKVANNEIKAFTYNFEQFESAIDLGNEIRGGK